MIHYSALLKSLLSFGTTFRLGVSRSRNGWVHALVSVHKKGRTAPVSAGPGVPALARLLVPGLASCDLDSAPVFLFSEKINGTDPLKWVDSNEAKIIPAGATADAIIHDYTAIEGTIYSATVLKSAVETAVKAAAGSAVEPGSLSVPLWNLAKLYVPHVREPFVLWKITSSGSVLGYVNNGKLERLLNIWISCDDIAKEPASQAAAAGKLIRSFAAPGRNLKIILFSPETDFKMPPDFVVEGCSVDSAPAAAGIPIYCHEAFANAAAAGEGSMDFLSFHQRRKARQSEQRSMRMLAGVRLAFWVLAGLLVVMACTDVALRGIDRVYHRPMEQLKTQTTLLKAAEKRRSLLLDRLGDRIRFSGERSGVTNLLSALESVFPENSRAEAVAVDATEKNNCKVELEAETGENGLINEVLKNVRNMDAVSEARLVSSEQADSRTGGAKVVRFKITFTWQGGR